MAYRQQACSTSVTDTVEGEDSHLEDELLLDWQYNVSELYQ